MVLWRVEAASLLGQELVQVLKLLDEDAWDDANINALLARADSNGDGALQVVEFLNWILGPVWIGSNDQSVPRAKLRADM